MSGSLGDGHSLKLCGSKSEIVPPRLYTAGLSSFATCTSPIEKRATISVALTFCYPFLRVYWEACFRQDSATGLEASSIWSNSGGWVKKHLVSVLNFLKPRATLLVLVGTLRACELMPPNPSDCCLNLSQPHIQTWVPQLDTWSSYFAKVLILLVCSCQLNHEGYLTPLRRCALIITSYCIQLL